MRRPTMRANAACLVVAINSPEQIRAEIVDPVTRRIPQRFDIPAPDVRVAPLQYQGPCGIDARNRALQAALNPKAAHTAECPWGQMRYCGCPTGYSGGRTTTHAG